MQGALCNAHTPLKHLTQWTVPSESHPSDQVLELPI